jgi:SsrA-binding protein
MAKSKSKKGSVGPSGEKVLATNRRASFDYELGEKFEAGLCLIGSEARSIRTISPGIGDAFIDVDRNGEAWVKQMRIAPMSHAAFSHDELRPRKLLLNRHEIDRMRAAIEREGMTLIPVRLYYKGGRAKLELAIARGKKMYDKRQSLKEKTANEEARAAMVRGRKDY